jgi:hypothetical protein
MAASIALGCGGKVLVFGLRPWRGKRQAKFVTRLIFVMQRFFCSRKPSWHVCDGRQVLVPSSSNPSRTLKPKSCSCLFQYFRKRHNLIAKLA